MKEKPKVEPVVFRVKDLAARWGCDSAAIYNMLSGGKLRHMRIGVSKGAIRIPKEAVYAYEAANGIVIESEPKAVTPELAAAMPFAGTFPRMLNEYQACTYIGCPVQEFQKRCREWYDQNSPFPVVHPMLGLYDKAEIDHWIDRTRRKYYEEQISRRAREPDTSANVALLSLKARQAGMKARMQSEKNKTRPPEG